MARRTVSTALLEDGLQRGIDWDGKTDRDPLRPDPREYVSVTVDGSPFERLLWREIKNMMKWARLTDWQEAVFIAHLKGLSIAETALIYNRKTSTIKTHLRRAWEKCARAPHRGMLTVMIEELGWPAVREHMSNKLEMRIKEARKNAQKNILKQPKKRAKKQ